MLTPDLCMHVRLCVFRARRAGGSGTKRRLGSADLGTTDDLVSGAAPMPVGQQHVACRAVCLAAQLHVGGVP